MRNIEQQTADTWPSFAQWLLVTAPELGGALIICAVMTGLLILELRK